LQQLEAQLSSLFRCMHMLSQLLDLSKQRLHLCVRLRHCPQLLLCAASPRLRHTQLVLQLSDVQAVVCAVRCKICMPLDLLLALCLQLCMLLLQAPVLAPLGIEVELQV
jgi:hypothetical protein